MKKCPICNNPLDRKTRKSGRPVPGRHLSRCPHCGYTLRKKFSILFVPALLGYAVILANFRTNWIFSVLAVVGGVALCVFYVLLPYEPYDRPPLGK